MVLGTAVVLICVAVRPGHYAPVIFMGVIPVTFLLERRTATPAVVQLELDQQNASRGLGYAA